MNMRNTANQHQNAYAGTSNNEPPCPYRSGTAQAVLWRQMQDAVRAKRSAEEMIAEYEATRRVSEMTISAMSEAIAKLELEQKS